MDYLLSVYRAAPPELWAALFGTPFIVAVVNVSKRLLKKKSDLVIHSITGTVSALLSLLPVVLNHPETFKAFGLYSTAFFTAANFLYAVIKAVSPVVAKIKAYNDSRKTAKVQTVPATAELQPVPEYEG